MINIVENDATAEAEAKAFGDESWRIFRFALMFRDAYKKHRDVVSVSILGDWSSSFPLSLCEWHALHGWSGQRSLSEAIEDDICVGVCFRENGNKYGVRTTVTREMISSTDTDVLSSMFEDEAKNISLPTIEATP